MCKKDCKCPAKNFKIEFKTLLTVVSAVGMVAAFITALFSKKKAVSCVAFFASFAGLVAGIGMEKGVVPTPACCNDLELEFGDDDWEDWMEDEEEEEECAEDECAEECAEECTEECAEPAEAEEKTEE